MHGTKEEVTGDHPHAYHSKLEVSSLSSDFKHAHRSLAERDQKVPYDSTRASHTQRSVTLKRFSTNKLEAVPVPSAASVTQRVLVFPYGLISRDSCRRLYTIDMRFLSSYNNGS